MDGDQLRLGRLHTKRSERGDEEAPPARCGARVVSSGYRQQLGDCS